jgi:hypothetical protein
MCHHCGLITLRTERALLNVASPGPLVLIPTGMRIFSNNKNRTKSKAGRNVWLRGRGKVEKYRGEREREARAIVAWANRKSVAVVESKVWSTRLSKKLWFGKPRNFGCSRAQGRKEPRKVGRGSSVVCYKGEVHTHCKSGVGECG